MSSAEHEREAAFLAEAHALVEAGLLRWREERLPFVYVVVLLGADSAWVASEPGRVFVWQSGPLADQCAHRLEERGLRALVLRRTLPEIADLLADHGLDETAFELVEAQAVSRDDAAAWSRELADRIADRIGGEAA